MIFKINSLPLYFILLLLLCSGISSMYVMRNSHEGNLVHIFEQKMPKVNSDNKVSDIKYDYTYVEYPDSVTFLSYITLPQSETPISISFQNNEIEYSQDSELIFVQPKGNKFQYRLKIVLPFQIWKNIYEDPTPFKIQYLFDRKGQTVEYIFGYKGKKWESNRQKILEIINIIELNKK